MGGGAGGNTRLRLVFLPTILSCSNRFINLTFLILYYIKQIDSKLPCVYSVIDHRGRQNVVRTSVTHSAAPHT